MMITIMITKNDYMIMTIELITPNISHDINIIIIMLKCW